MQKWKIHIVFKCTWYHQPRQIVYISWKIKRVSTNFKKIKIIHVHYKVITNSNKNKETPDIWWLNKIIIINTWSRAEITKKIQKYFTQNGKEYRVLKSRFRVVPMENNTALAGVGQWFKHQPVNQKVTSSIPSQGTCPGCEVPSWGCAKGNQQTPLAPIFLSLSFSLPSPLSKNK